MGLFPPTCKLLAGSWSEDTNMMVGDRLGFFKEGNSDPNKVEAIELSRVTSVEIATSETVQKLGSTIGLGLLGSVILGPVGLIAGVFASRKKMVNFIFKLDDGRQAIAYGEEKAYLAMQMAIMKKQVNRSLN
ncbi:hypothetical protein K7W42_17680 [Deinococcus sp. HMF7604]|uniref:hypothetical protein n=1 Tax=Deinococcus betulae TaxID=2873312 RepID=UPI001CCCE551|nr:hypothetical protein [Deinococcus betulae]MBZ9752676.1 hypothetical protein [Deinococcus betulae]